MCGDFNLPRVDWERGWSPCGGEEEVPAMGRGCLATTGPHTVLAGRGQTEGQTLGHLFAKFSPSEVRALPEQVKTIPIL